MDLNLEVTILVRLVVAMVLTGVLGWERETRGRAAGLRTHMLVGVGAALFVGLGEVLVKGFREYGELQQFDPTRMLEAVVAGVSFLGAGSIFFARGDRVHGLTTAASLWTTAGVGMAAGVGRYVLATGATLLVFFILRVLLRLEQKAIPQDATKGSGDPADEDRARRASI